MASRLMWMLRASAFARKLGLGPVIDRARPAIVGRVGRGDADVGGLVLEAETIEDRLYFEQLRGGREGFMAELFERTVAPGSVVADVGANMGYFTLLAARNVGSQGAVYAFEPDPRAVQRLRAHVTRNGCDDVVTVVPKALSSETGTATFYVRDASDVSSLYDDEPYARRVEVEVLAGDRFFADARPFDVLKIDVEGAEPAVLAGLRESVRRSGVRAFVECNPSALAAGGSSAEALLGALRGAGFSIQVIDEEARKLRPIDGSTSRLEPYVNLYCER